MDKRKEVKMSAANSGSVGRGKPAPQPIWLFDVPLDIVEPVLVGAGFDLEELAAGMEDFIREAGSQSQTQEV